ncbi:arginine N-succinyltransferase [Marinomonas transparens]|uniref:Arginine N-succinyltransferase n=1 Tax=Marinomonas transparens TaxID=2795388 RepID=A0A934JVD4_9GAMM|nr:arginine N-succinyltransferase [Marinomonas transparens]MBJ7538982.1 arginine N-succinyltransferase [Marinomonas transparens]
MMVIRPIRQSDLKALYRLAEKTGVGFTSLIPNEAILQKKVDGATASFAKESVSTPNNEDYLMVLEDTATGDIVGTCGILATVGLEEPFYSYHLGTITHASRELGVHNAIPTLILNNDFTGFSEICTLFLEEDYRHSKNGQFLSKSRFMFMAQFPERFTEKVFAEMRGISDEKGVSPFWEGLGRHFFSIDFERADELTSLGSKQFIAELMPNNPVYVNLLPPEAREVLGKVHKNTQPARHLLEQEGFRYENYVDIFDGGPSLEARVQDIRAVRDSRLYLANIGLPKGIGEGSYYLVSNTKLMDFRCILIQRAIPPSSAMTLTQEEAEHLCIINKEPIRIVELSPYAGR